MSALDRDYMPPPRRSKAHRLTYETKQGQAWDEVAKEALGSEMHMHRLMEANPEYRHMVFFPAAVSLRLPEIEAQFTETAPPPWKQR